ncbi:unnamed protein product [Ceutorhynchus assimilis]|uniref:Peptidase S1 domain-containing protein n=1 Tax=Ceutorhynchus assimilis TaxID=467358 RepID=A0A9N9MFD7_9CUCU|nr:unnamed protein product [Ceutorhynchus assimilis]
MCFDNRTLLLWIICAIKMSFCYDWIDGNNATSNRFLSDEGSACQKLGLAGICRKVNNCPIALDAIRRKRPHNLLRCGFVGIDEVVCCPDLAERNPVDDETSTIDQLTVWSELPVTKNPVDTKTPSGRLKAKRKCEIMCEKIYKDNNIAPVIDFHVLNGEDAKTGQFPHMAALGYKDKDDSRIIDWRRCGASLISSRFLLSAAHCSFCSDCEDPVKARFGVVDLRDDASAQDIDVKSVTIFEKYNGASRHNDLALVELVRDVKTSRNVYPACLHVPSDDPEGLLVTGWGQTQADDTDSRSFILQFAVIQPVAINRCNTTILSKSPANTLKTIVNSQICAISTSDACQGDSGGPIQIMTKGGGYDIVGIVSYGIQCGSTAPGIYTRVSAYLDWIEEKVWPS